MNVRDCMSIGERTTSPQDTIREAACMMKEADTGAFPVGENDCLAGLVPDARNELVDFVVHRVFYPVLMLQRTGPHKARIEHIQDATRAEIDRFRGYKSVEEVIANFKHDLRSKPAKGINSELKLLNLPVLHDLHEDFERKARELGYEPDTLLTSPYLDQIST